MPHIGLMIIAAAWPHDVALLIRRRGCAQLPRVHVMLDGYTLATTDIRHFSAFDIFFCRVWLLIDKF